MHPYELPITSMRIPYPRLTRADWLALGAITLAVLIFYAPVWLLGNWMPSGGGDLVSFIWPTYTFAARTLHSGQLPLWIPHLYSGAPFWADNQSGVLYPVNWLLFLLPSIPYQALEGMVMAHIWFTGVAMYACLRLITSPPRPHPRPLSTWWRGESHWKNSGRREGVGRGETGVRSVGPPAAALGAIAWMLSDVFVTHQGHYNLIAVAAWLPLVLLGMWRGLRDLDWRWAILGGVAFGLGTLAGHAQITYYTVLLMIGVGLWWIGARIRESIGGAVREPPLRNVWKTIGLLALIAATGLGLSAGGWLPALEMTRYTARAALSYEEASKFSLAPQGLVGLVAPWVYGRGPFRFSGPFERVAVGYIGVTALILAVLGMVQGIRQRRKWAIFLTVLWVIAFLAALGRYLPLHRLLYDFLPGFQSIRAPARLMLLVNMAWAMLAALGLESIPWQRLKTRGLSLLLRWVPVALVAAELIGFGATVEIQSGDPRTGYDTYTEAAAWLAEQPDAPFRIDTYFPANDSWQQPDFAALVGGPLYDIYGIYNPLTVATYQSYYLSLGWRGSPPYNFLGVKYVLTAGDAPGDATFVPVHQTASGLTIFLNTGALPMASLVYRAAPVDDQSKAWELVHQPDWDPRALVYVEGGPPLDSTPPPGANVSYTRYEANEIDLTVSTPAPAYLVLSEVYYPGWQATVDGQPTPIYRANSTFRAIYLDEPGQHSISLAFRPITVYVGLAISAATALGLAAVGGMRSVRRSG